MKKIIKYFVIITFCALLFPSLVKASGVTLNNTSFTIEQGKSAKLVIKAENALGKIKIKNINSDIISVDQSVIWIDNEEITININGLTIGNALIYVMLDDVTTYNKEELTNNYIISVEVVERNLKLEKPKLKASLYDNGKVLLSWNEQNSTKCEIYRSTNNKKFTKIDTLKSSDTSYKDTKASIGKTYYYKIIVSNSKYKSAYSKVVSVKSIPLTVKNLTITSVSSDSISLKWDKVGVTGYEIYSGTKTSKMKKIATIKKSSTLTYKNKKLKDNTTYYYKVRAYKTVSGKKVYGGFSNIVSDLTAPKKPQLKLSVKDINQINLEVTSSKGAVKYILESSLDNNNYELYQEYKDVPQIVIGDLETGTTYYYRVKACNKNYKCSAYTSSKILSTIKTPSITLKTTSKKVIITVNTVNGAVGYELFVATSKTGKYKKIQTLDNDNLTYTYKTTKGKTYYFKVKGFTLDKVYSSLSGVKSIKSK